jgi:hypothetical protein
VMLTRYDKYRSLSTFRPRQEPAPATFDAVGQGVFDNTPRPVSTICTLSVHLIRCEK